MAVLLPLPQDSVKQTVEHLNCTRSRNEKPMSSFFALDDLEAGFSGGDTPISGGRRAGSYRAMSLFSYSGAVGGDDEPGRHFLDSCSLCNKPLRGDRDIFMYRGDRPFCSEECRQVQIDADEAEEMRRTTPSAGKKRLPSLAMKEQQIHVRGAGTLVAG